MTKAVQYAHPRNGFGEALVALAEEQSRIVAVTADVAESVRLAAFAERFPERFFDVGVAEQNMMGVAAGLAVEGYIPFCAAYAAFSPGRNWDQLRVSVCYNKANVKIIGTHAGLNVGADGATHQALEDIAITRVLPNLTVLVPADIYETKAAIKAAAAHDGPVYVRISRETEPIIFEPRVSFPIGKARQMSQGTDVTVVTTGSMLAPAMIAAERVKAHGVSVDLLHYPTIKPFDTAALIRSARKTKAVVTVEDAQIVGGLGGVVAETITSEYPVMVWRVGMRDSFGASGAPKDLYRIYHISEKDITAAIMTASMKKR